MKRIVFGALALIVIASAYSCKKEKKGVPKVIDSPVIVYDNYACLKPGNYWIYQDYMIDSAGGAAHAQGTFDSVYVEKDTVINGNTYHKYVDVPFLGGSLTNSIYMLRDSLSYLVNSGGRILFSSTDFTTVFRTYTYGPNNATPDTLHVTEQMGFKDVTITVDAGSFVTSTFRQIFNFPASYPFAKSREYDHRYTKNVGLVSYTTGFYTALPSYYERRLVRYHVN